MSTGHVFLTRPAGRNGSVPGRLRAAGMQVTELPALELRPLKGCTIPEPAGFELIIFVSRYAVQRFFHLWHGRAEGKAGDAGATWPPATLAGAVGASTGKALRAAGLGLEHIVHPPADVQDQDSEALVRELEARGLQPRRVLIVRGTDGRPWLSEALAARGAHVEYLPLYERVPANWAPDLTAQLKRVLQANAGEDTSTIPPPGGVDAHTGLDATSQAHSRRCIFLLTSSDGVRAMAQRLRELGLIHLWSNCAFVVIHERIAATLQSEIAPHRIDDLERLALCTPDDNAIVEAIRAVAGPTAEP